jgi:hypothetical protein
MKRIFAVLFMGLLVAHYAVAQLDTTRVEIPIRPNETRPTVVPMAHLGFALLDKRQQNLLEPSNVVKVTGYDSNMQQQWQESITHNKRLSLRLYEYQEGKLYLVFGNQFREEVEFYVFDPTSGQVQRHLFNYLENLLIEDFTVMGNDIYLLGTMKRLPVLLAFQLDTKKVAPLSMAVSAKNVEVLELFKNGDSQVGATVSIEVNKTKQLLTKTFDLKTGEGHEFVVKPSDQYDLLNGKVTVLNAQDKLVMGTYGYHNRPQSQGMYIAGYVGDREVIKKYHQFTDMSNFFSFLGEKEQKRIEERATKKAQKGKDMKLKYRLLVHNAIAHNNQYVMLGEAYYPTYRSERYRRYGPRGYYYDTRVVFDGYKFTHAVVAAIDKRGELVWDHSFKINDTKTFQLKERVKLNAQENLITLIYNLEGEIFQLQIANGEILNEVKGVDVNTTFTSDEVRNSDLGEAEYWYDHYFLAWGFQKIKNNKGESDKNKRNVFYINKLSY